MSYQEFPVFVPLGRERLAAVVCVPGGGTGDLGVVLLPGGYSRTHRNRMWVRAARDLAARGFPSIRLDYHGVGDSTGTATFDTERPFDDDALAATEFLGRATGVRRFAMVATCFGGRAAFAAAERNPDVVSVTVTPMPMMVPRAAPRGRPSAGSRLKPLLGGRAAVAWMARRPAVRRLRRRIRRRTEERFSPHLVAQVTRFLRRGQAWFIWGEYNGSLAQLRDLIARVEPELTAEQRRRIHVEVVPGTELAGFRTVADQDATVRWSVESVERAAAALRGPTEPGPVRAADR